VLALGDDDADGEALGDELGEADALGLALPSSTGAPAALNVVM
jgi:hypothetical protein